ncbi:MAG TPA: class I SAM-dependent methyltransferase [Tepidisphaeraceae bacterium]|jgi:SAM-dependent methyltransferase
MSRVMPPHYLQPYSAAAQRFGGGFGSLLWASPKTQRARFDALVRLADFGVARILDLGCGRCDLLDYLLARSIVPAQYIGVEAIAPLADAARGRNFASTTVIDGDFIKNPSLMNQRADVIVFSGSLNTLEPKQFYLTLDAAFAATTDTLVFNFLSTPLLAGKPFLHWHHPEDVAEFARGLTPDVRYVNDYLDGDCTLMMRKNSEHQ